jgi:hypothetical protein
MPGTGVSEPHSNKASHTGPNGDHGVVAPTLPASGLSADASPGDYLRAAGASLVAGRGGQAQQALEMAETRLLDRSVPSGDQDKPLQSQRISQIHDAIQAVGNHGARHAIALIDQALAG